MDMAIVALTPHEAAICALAVTHLTIMGGVPSGDAHAIVVKLQEAVMGNATNPSPDSPNTPRLDT